MDRILDKLFLFLLLVSFTLSGVPAFSYAENSGDYYGPVADIVAKPGTNRSLGSLNLMLPIAQSPDEMLFADVRMVMDNHDNSEGNIGLAYRRVVDLDDEDYIWGVYGFYDRRRSEHDNYFSQATVGTELMGEQWRARFNYYEPLGETEKFVSDSEDTATLLPSGFVSVSPNTVVEESLRGLDLELSVNVPFISDKSWAHAGVYHFGLGNEVNLNGVRFRGETDITDNIRFGLETSYDNIRGPNHFAEIRYRIPLGAEKKNKTYHKSIHRYMMEPIVRDIDIVATNKSLKAAIAESGGVRERYYFVDNTAPAGGRGRPNKPFSSLAEAEAKVRKNSTIFVRRGDGTTNNMDQGITITKKNVRLIGSGIDLRTRQGVLVESATSAPKITNVGGDAVTIAANDIEVAGFSIENALYDGIFVHNYRRSNIHHNLITGSGQNGINLAYTDNRNYSDIIVEHNRTNNNGRKGIYFRSYNGADVGAQVYNNTASGNAHEGIRFETAGTDATLDVFALNNTTHSNSGAAGLYAITGGTSDLTLTINSHYAHNNNANGAMFITGGSGTHDIVVNNLHASGNGQRGIGVDAQNDTNTSFGMKNSSGSNNGTDGLYVISRSNSNLDAEIVNHVSNNNGHQNVDVMANGAGTRLDIALGNISATGASNGGMFLQARSGAELDVILYNSTLTGNGPIGLYVEGSNTADLNARIQGTDITNSGSYNLNLTDFTSGIYNVDLGGGTLGSAGQNRIFGAGNIDVIGNLGGSNVAAQKNWWGVSSGLDAGSELSISNGGSVDASNHLTSDPRP